MYNRCQNELNPRFKALTQSEVTFQNEINQAQDTLNELQDYINELEKEIKNIQDTFEETYKPNNEEYQEIENQLSKIQIRIQELEYEIDNNKSEVQQKEIIKFDAINQKSLRDTEYDQYQQHYQQISQQLKDQLRRERQLQNEGFSNPIIEELQLLVAQIKCDKESASKRFSYVENKLKNSQDSVQHAKQVLENHILQAQQEQLNHKVQTTNNQFNVKRNSAMPLQNGNQILYGPTLTSRVSNIQQKGQTLQHGQVLSPSREESRIENSRNMSIRKEHTTPAQITSDQERMHSHYIDQNQSQIMTEMKRDNFNNSHIRNISNTQNQSFHLMHSNSGHQLTQGYKNPQNQKSQNDIVRYSESSSSQSLNDQSNMSNHLNQYLNNKNPANQRSIPIQSLITPRDPLQELQNLKQNNNHFIYETQQQMSAMSNDSINNSTCYLDRKQSVCNETISNFYDTQSSNIQSYSNQQRLPLRQHNSQSIDGKQQSNTKNVVIPLYTQFKENITPNNLSAMNNTNNSFNMRKLSQASNMSQISNQSILNTIQSISQNGTRPPAVPQSKMYMTSGGTIQMEDTTPRQNMHKTRTASMRMTTNAKLNHTQNNNNGNSSLLYATQSNNSRNTSKDSFITQPNKSIQTKIKLQINVNNTGRPIQIGVVDLSKCQQSSKDSQFFESVKPLIDGAQFLVAQDGQYVLKQFYIDFSLMRIFLVNFNGEKEIIMIDNIIKPEMPQSTLDQIRQEKNNSPSGQSSNSNSNGNKKYEFNLIVNIGGQLQRLQILAMTYEELRKWIVGINALLQNKNQLMRLSSNIVTINN